MPIYAQKCENCGATRTIIAPIRRRNERVPCGICGKGRFKRDMSAETCNSTDMPYDKPVLSDSLGVHPDQVQEHRRQHPEIPILDDGRVVLTSHNQRKKVLKKLGFFDRAGYC